MKPQAWWGIALGALLLGGCLALVTSCTPTERRDAVYVAQGVDLACRIADTQPEPAWLHLVCQGEEAAEPGVVKLLDVRVPRADAGSP